MSKWTLPAAMLAFALAGTVGASANPHKYFNPHRGIPHPHHHHHHHHHRHHHHHHHDGAHHGER